MTPVQSLDDTAIYPFLVKTLITFTQDNEGGVEKKNKEEVVFKLDKASAAMPWYALRNYLVPKYLNNKYGPEEVGWKRIYEIKINKQIKRSDPNDITDIPLRIMTREQLVLYCIKWELVVPIEEFYSVEKAREMVTLRQEDEKGYKKHLAEYREGLQRSYPEMDKVRGKDSVAIADKTEFNMLENREETLPPVKEVVGSTPVTPEDIAKVNEDASVPTSDDPFAGI